MNRKMYLVFAALVCCMSIGCNPFTKKATQADFDALEGTVGTMQSDVTDIKDAVTAQSNTINGMANQMNGMTAAVNGLTANQNTMGELLTSVKTQCDERAAVGAVGGSTTVTVEPNRVQFSATINGGRTRVTHTGESIDEAINLADQIKRGTGGASANPL